ncbi:MAG: hypothetical protein U0821_05705 [Chloroflexota bacterium]
MIGTVAMFASVLLGVAAAVVGLRVVHRRIPHEQRRQNNEVAGFLITVLGAIYGVLLAFVVVAVWGDFEDARKLTQREASAMLVVYRFARLIPEGRGREIQHRVVQYAGAVTGPAWAAMAVGRADGDVLVDLDALWREVERFEPRGDKETQIFDHLLDAMQEISVTRAERLLAARTGMPTLMWVMLVGGAVITVAFTFFFSAPSHTAQVAMTVLYALSIAGVLMLVAALDFPFTGPIALQPEAIQEILHTFQRIEATGLAR